MNGGDVQPDDGQTGRAGFARATRVLLYAVAVALLLAAAAMLYLAYEDDLRFASDQAQLSSSLPVTTSVIPSVQPTDPLDFSGWVELDFVYWTALKEGGAFARLVAKDAGIDDVAVKGASDAQLAKAPGWIVQTDMPGPEGNCAISGHRVTHGHPFRRLDRLKIGATIYLYSPYRRYRYEVDKILRVTPDHVEVVAHTTVPHLTLTTCDPPGQAVKRLVVQARLVGVERLSETTSAAIPAP